MKKKLVLSILGMAALSSFGQGVIRLDTYNTYGPYVTYGAGSDGALGTGLSSAYTMGIYYWNALGNFVGSTAADPTRDPFIAGSFGYADPTTLGNYVLGTGLGSTAVFGFGGTPGAAYSGFDWAVPIVPGPTGGATITLIIVAYEGASYDTAIYRSHSAPFTIVTSDASSPDPVKTGSAMPWCGVFPVPEPSTFAFVLLGGGAWLCYRCRRARIVR